MNATLATPATETRHPVQQQHPQPQSHRRVGLVDRAALHLGVALIKWGRRRTTSQLERRANRLERALALNRRLAHVSAHREVALREHSVQLHMR